MEDDERMPSGMYYKMLMEIVPRIYAVLLERDLKLIDRGYDADGDGGMLGLGEPDKIAESALYHAHILINEIYKNRFND